MAASIALPPFSSTAAAALAATGFATATIQSFAVTGARFCFASRAMAASGAISSVICCAETLQVSGRKHRPSRNFLVKLSTIVSSSGQKLIETQCLRIAQLSKRLSIQHKFLDRQFFDELLTFRLEEKTNSHGRKHSKARRAFKLKPQVLFDCFYQPEDATVIFG
jgi:hypothetical protein